MIICEKKVDSRMLELRRTRLKFCDRYWVVNAIDTNKCKINDISENDCQECFKDVLSAERKAMTVMKISPAGHVITVW